MLFIFLAALGVKYIVRAQSVSTLKCCCFVYSPLHSKYIFQCFQGRVYRLLRPSLMSKPSVMLVDINDTSHLNKTCSLKSAFF